MAECRRTEFLNSLNIGQILRLGDFGIIIAPAILKFEIVKGNPAYLKYSKEIGIVTTKFNLMELYYRLLVMFGIEIAEFSYNKYKQFSVEVDDDIIKKAMQFRALNKSKDLSYVDCVGYIFANEKKIKFLTGVIQFKDMPNVEFVR